MLVVSDTSPLRALGFLGRLDLLPAFYGDILLPPLVAEELRSPRAPELRIDIAAFPALRVQAPRTADPRIAALHGLHAAESEALSLALDVGADVVLIDELAGRSAVVELGMVPVGVIGILIRAKQAGAIVAVAPELTRLRDGLRFHLSGRLITQALADAGEG